MYHIDWYIASSKTEQQAIIVEMTHEIIVSTIPRVTVARKYKIPFYTYIKDLCYLNYHKDHLYVAFIQGQMIEHPYLDKSTTKMVAKYYIHKPEDVQSDNFVTILLDACALQEEVYGKR